MRRPAAALFALAVLVALAAPAAAHEDRKAGPLSVVVGLTPEPAIAGQSMAIEVFLEQNGKPVVLTATQLKGLAAHMFAAKLTKPPVDADYDQYPNRKMPLHAAFDSPGEYRSDAFIPTSPTDLTIHLATAKNVKIAGQSFNWVFVAGPDTYGPIQDPTALMFPTQVPTAAQMAAKIDRVAADVETVATDQAAATDTAQMVTLALAAALLLTLGVAVWALVRTRRLTRVPDTPADLIERTPQS